MTEQVTHEDLKSMTPMQIAAALDAGSLDELLGRPRREPIPTFPTEADLARMTPEEINQALREGRLNHLLEGRTIGENE
ncbi:hypothetical protein ACFVAJ_11225 [Agromyces sp. NPDC057679]|uniref:hypothetical protein n=1 Tax=Agromyces sp. NPDC057679 TaxID=3346207 RepID=UPI00366A7746